MANVYFTKDISAEALAKAYLAAGVDLKGRVAVKIHSGEPGGENYLRPGLMAPLVKKLHGTIVECNTAYGGGRSLTPDHLRVLAEHGFSGIAKVEVLDAKGEMELPVRGGRHLKADYVGAGLADYDSVLVLSHFKGHAMGGFGGALKQLSIGLASARGKAVIHGAGDPARVWTADHDSFLESMAEAASAVADYLKRRVSYINVMCNLSVDCDCDSHPAKPCMRDIGVLSSTDPVSLDQACLDLVYSSEDPGKAALVGRIESRNGAHTVEEAEKLGVGSRKYILIDLDKEKNE
jgi:uncharacterized Fe-S center protein